MCVAMMPVQQDARSWEFSARDPPLPAMTDSQLAPGREVLCKRYCTGVPVEAIILGLSRRGDEFAHSRNAHDYENAAAPVSAVQGPQEGPLLQNVLNLMPASSLFFVWALRLRKCCVKLLLPHAHRTVCPTNTWGSGRITWGLECPLDAGGGQKRGAGMRVSG